MMIQNKTLPTLSNKLVSESSRSTLSLIFSLVPHLHCLQPVFHALYCKQLRKCVTMLFCIVTTDDNTLELWNPQKNNWFKTPHNRGNTCQVFCGKPYHVTIIGTSFGFQRRKFSEWSHSSTSSHHAATVGFCLHVADRHLWHWREQSPNSAWSDES